MYIIFRNMQKIHALCCNTKALVSKWVYYCPKHNNSRSSFLTMLKINKLVLYWIFYQQILEMTKDPIIPKSYCWTHHYEVTWVIKYILCIRMYIMHRYNCLLRWFTYFHSPSNTTHASPDADRRNTYDRCYDRGKRDERYWVTILWHQHGVYTFENSNSFLLPIHRVYIYNTSIAAWIKSPFRRTNENNYRYN